MPSGIRYDVLLYTLLLYSYTKFSAVPGQPLALGQNKSENTENSTVVQWEAPEETGGVSISTYRVTVNVEGMRMSENVSGNMFTLNISGLEYNTPYEVNVTAINSCGIPSEPATITVFINASGESVLLT